MAKKPKTYRLGSAPLIYTPGVIRWAINGYNFPKDRPRLLDAVVNGFPGPKAPDRITFHRLLKGDIPYKVEGEAVVFTV